MTISSISTIQFPHDRRALKVSRLIHALTEVLVEMKPRRSDEFELYYPTTGEMTINLDGKTEILGEGHIRFIRPGQILGIGSCSRSVSFYHCHFAAIQATVSYTESRLREWACLISRMNEGASDHSRSLHLPDRMLVSARSTVTEIFAQLLRRQRERGHGFELAYEAQFLLLLQYLSELTVRKLAETKEPLNLSAPEVHVTRAFDLIERWLGRDVSLYDISRQLDVNAAYLSRIFKATAGVTVGNYILRRKIAMAQERLLSTRLNVKQVAASVGFNDQRYFCRKFRRETGMSPREYQLHHHR